VKGIGDKNHGGTMGQSLKDIEKQDLEAFLQFCGKLSLFHQELVQQKIEGRTYEQIAKGTRLTPYQVEARIKEAVYRFFRQREIDTSKALGTRDAPVSDELFGKRALDALLAAGITSLFTLAQWTEEDLSRLRGLGGYRGLREINRVLEEHGLALRSLVERAATDTITVHVGQLCCRCRKKLARVPK
jgi:DNA-directed RNA polymerase alpha subunit